MENELTHRQGCESEASIQALSSVRAELDRANAENDALRKKLEKTAKVELEGKAPQAEAELKTLRAQLKKCAAVAARCEAVEQKVRTLELSTREEAEKGAKVRAELEDQRLQAKQLAAERDSMAAKCQEAGRRIEALEESQEKSQE